MASWFELPITKDEAFVLRELLAQTASPGSFQSQFIIRLDAKLEEEERPRRGRDLLFQPSS